MATELEEAIQQTQQTLRLLFAKPKCSLKLLTKPPFRFIHDIVTATMASTGFPRGYFNSEELNSKALKDKASKIAFLDKMMYLVGVCVGFPIDVRPAKIVAGLEPLHTNVLLTQFGQVAGNRDIDHNGAIKHCIIGGDISDFPTTAQKTTDEPELDVPIKPLEEEKSEIDVIVSEPNVIIDKEDQVRSMEKDKSLEQCDKSSRDPALPIDRFENNSALVSTHQKTQEKGFEVIDRNESLKMKVNRCNSDPETTKSVIGEIIRKPKCSEKLLSKPPFRFLHDIIMAINKAKNMGLDRIYSNDEMDSSKVKDKESKINFLKKIIAHVQAELDISIELNPVKVVAGLDPEQTSNFLQIFALLASTIIHQGSTISSNSAAASCTKEGNTQHRTGGVEQSAKVTIVDTLPNISLPDKEPTTIDNSHRSSRNDTNGELKKLHPTAEAESQKIIAVPLSTTKNIQKNTKTDDEVTGAINRDITNKKANTPSPETEDFAKAPLAPNMILEEAEQRLIRDKISEEDANNVKAVRAKAKSISQTFFGIENGEMDRNDFILDALGDDSDPRIISTRPKTARRMPPRSKEKKRVLGDRALKYSTTAKPIIFKDDDEDEQNKQSLTNEKKIEDEIGKPTLVEKQSPTPLSSLHGQTAAVQNILHEAIMESTNSRIHKEKQEDEACEIPTTSLVGHSRVRPQLYMGKKPRNLAMAKHAYSTITTATPYNCNDMAKSIQNMVRSANPIGRLMNCIPSDLTKMNREINNWKICYAQSTSELEAERTRTVEELKPIQSQVSAVDDEIDRLKLMIQNLNAKLNQNEIGMQNRLRQLIR